MVVYVRDVRGILAAINLSTAIDTLNRFRRFEFGTGYEQFLIMAGNFRRLSPHDSD